MVNAKDPRVIRTKQLIKIAFRELLSVKGFDDITITDITKKATINRATFYAHYEDKYALLIAITEDVFYEMLPDSLLHAPTINQESCEQLIKLVYQYIITFYKVCKMEHQSVAAIIDEKIKSLLNKIIESILLKNENYKKRTDIDISLIAAMMSSTLYSAVYYWTIIKENHSIDDLSRFVSPYVLNGLTFFSNVNASNDVLKKP